MHHRLKRFLLYLVLVIGSTLAALGTGSGGLGAWAELKTYDLRFWLRGPLPSAHLPITILALDDQSFEHIADPLMLWPRHMAPVIDAAAEHAAAIGIDVLISDLSEIDPEGQRDFLQALLRERSRKVPVILPYRVRRERVESPPFPLLAAAGEDSFAFINLTTDSDDFVRRQELFSETEDGTLARSFAYSLWEAVAQHGWEDLPQTLLINFRGRHPFPTVSFWSAVEAAQDKRVEFFAEHFKDRIVLLGMVGEEDLHATPLYYWPPEGQPPVRRIPGVEIHAQVVATLLEGNFIVPLPAGLPLLLTFVLVAGAASASFAFTPWRAVAIAFALLGVYLVFALLFAFSQGWWFPVIMPAVGVFGALGGAQTLNYALEGREKRRLRSLFRRYVNDQVIQQILDSPDPVLLQGQTRLIAVLFADIRNFTSRAEDLSAEDTVRLLNLYLSRMVTAIQGAQGMIDKFMGDGIMAVFGAPLESPRCADQAVQAARNMLQALDGINRELALSGTDPIRIGIGIHTGEAVVGNIGSPDRLEYTAIGDVVNTASRIEGLTKEYQAPLLISGATLERLADPDLFEAVGETAIRGRDRREPLFRLRETPSGPGDDAHRSDRSDASDRSD